MGILSHPYALLAPVLITISSNQTDFNLANYLTTNNFWNGTSAFVGTIVIASGTDIYATSISTIGFDVGNFPAGATLIINNAGNIYGAGGSSAGVKGGDAFLTTIALTMDNTGKIASGGGAGGNGGGASGGSNFESCDEDGDCTTSCINAQSVSGGSGGAGGGQSNESGTAGTAGGSGGASGCSLGGGAGGAGGAIGVAGISGGAGGASGCCSSSASAGQSGGAPGNAIDGFSLITFIASGTITGPTVN